MLAAKQLGVDRVPVRYLDLDPADAHLLALADNRLNEEATWNDEALGAVLEQLRAEGAELGASGFGDEEIARLLGELDAKKLSEVEEAEDAIIERPTVPDSQPGQAYDLGKHRLVCGDSTDPATWDLLLGGAKADLVWTDPPYGVAYVGKTKSALTIENDDLDLEELGGFLRDALSLAEAHTRPGGSWYVAAPSGVPFLAFGEVLNELGIWRQTLAWVKHTFALGRSDYHWRHESIFYGWKPGAAHYFVDDRKQDTVWEFDKPHRNADHPTMKPVELVQRAVRNSSKAGQLVVDCFGGSGTTLIAAAKEGRRAFLVEKDPGYCDVIRTRWDRFLAKAGAI